MTNKMQSFLKIKITVLLLTTVLSFCLFSCNNSQNVQQKTEIKLDSIVNEKLKIEKTHSIVKSKEEEFYTIDNIDIMKEDLGIFNYEGAEDACLKLKGAWRLPTSDELSLIYNHSDSLGQFKTKYYLGVGYDPEDSQKMVYRLDIMNGDIEFLQTNEEINSIYGFRPVRNHK